MTIAFTNKTGGTTVGDGPYTTASWTPSNGKLYLLACHARTNLTADTVQPSVTGNGLTWQLIADIVYDTTTITRKRLSLFRAMVTSGASAGATTITYTGQAQTYCGWVIDEVTGTDISGTHGSGAIVQSITGKDETGSASSQSLTLASGIGAGNATYGAFVEETEPLTATAGSGYTLLGTGHDGASLGLDTEYKVVGSTTVNISWSGASSALGGVGIEIKRLPVTAAITGTATASITEADIV